MFLAVTIIYFAVCYFLKVEVAMVLMIYTIAISVIKSVLVQELKSLFNLRKTREVYNKVGFLNTIQSLAAIFVMYFYYIIGSGVQLNVLNLIIFAIPILILYRFLVWGIISDIKNWQRN